MRKGFIDIALRKNIPKGLSLTQERFAKVIGSVIPAKAGIQNAVENWIPGHAPLARNDDFLLFSRVFHEVHGLSICPIVFSDNLRG
jgi:hypothetical protein